MTLTIELLEQRYRPYLCPGAIDGTGPIAATHEMRFAREVGDKLVFMHQGKVHEVGDPKTLFANPQTPELANFIGTNPL